MSAKTIISGPARFPLGNFLIQFFSAVLMVAAFIFFATLRSRPPERTDIIITTVILGFFFLAVVYFSIKAFRSYRFTLTDSGLEINQALGKMQIRIPYAGIQKVRPVDFLIAKRLYLTIDEKQIEWIKGSRQRMPRRGFFGLAVYPSSRAEADALYSAIITHARQDKQASQKPAATDKRKYLWLKEWLLTLIAAILWLPMSFVLSEITGMTPGQSAELIGALMVILIGGVGLIFQQELVLGYVAEKRKSLRYKNWMLIIFGAIVLVNLILTSAGLLEKWFGWTYQ